jgi:hypothetical protein
MDPVAVVDCALQDAAADPGGVVDALINDETRFDEFVDVKLLSPRHWARLLRGFAAVNVTNMKLFESAVAGEAKARGLKPKAQLDAQRQKVAAAQTDEERQEELGTLAELVKELGALGDAAMAAVELVHDYGAVLFHDRGSEGYVTFPVEKHFETWPLRSRGFKLWLRRVYYEKYGSALRKGEINEAREQLETEALFDGPEERIHMRFASWGNAIFLDLCDDEWRVVEITARGWRIMKQPPVKFVRHPDALLLPLPEPGGTVDDLRPFLNIRDEDWPLVGACLLAFARPQGPYPILVIRGEQGSAKSTTARVLRRLIDDHSPSITGPVTSERDLSIVARSEWVVNFANLSEMPAWLSDALCRLVYGEGFQTRRLYSDDDIAGFSEARPVVLNAIPEIVSRSDLLDRSVLIVLPHISDLTRQEEKEFWEAFEKARPKALGWLCDALVSCLKRYDGVRLIRLPRMADFARWATAGELALGLPEGGFMQAYEKNRAEGHLTALEASSITAPFRAFTAKLPGEWVGTASDLLLALQKITGPDGAKELPKTAQYLSKALAVLTPNLRHIGIEVTMGDREGTTGRRLIRLKRVTP